MAIDKVNGIKFSEIKTQLKTALDNDLSDYHNDLVLDTALNRLVRLPGKGETISFSMFDKKAYHDDKPVNAPGVKIESQPSNVNYFKNTGTVSASSCQVLITEPDNALPFPIIPGETKFYIIQPNGTARQLNSNEVRQVFPVEQFGRYILSAKYNSNNSVKNFKAYCFSLRSGHFEKAPAGWDISKEEDLHELGEIVKKEPSIDDYI